MKKLSAKKYVNGVPRGDWESSYEWVMSLLARFIRFMYESPTTWIDMVTNSSGFLNVGGIRSSMTHCLTGSSIRWVTQLESVRTSASLLLLVMRVPICSLCSRGTLCLVVVLYFPIRWGATGGQLCGNKNGVTGTSDDRIGCWWNIIWLWTGNKHNSTRRRIPDNMIY